MLDFFKVVLGCFIMMPAYGVIHGEPTPIDVVSTGQIHIEQLKWYGGTNSQVTEQDECSSVVVGTQPLTVLTVAHCLRDSKLTPNTRIPVVKIFLGKPVPVLRAALYTRFNEIERNLATDLAVLIFDGNAPEGIAAIPIVNSLESPQVLVCGYGRGINDADINVPRCANKTVLSAEDDFYHFVPEIYEQLDPLLHLQFRAQFLAKYAVISSTSALLAMNRVENERYQFTLPMPTRGDSGGPWIVNQQNGQQGVIALTSFVETFYRKNKQWPFFNENRAPLTDFPYAAYGVRLNTVEAKALFTRARLEGADIQMMSE
ncbi:MULTISPECIES: trypsin [unclassified Methylophaga]|jgi:hypothetical protein|uniref:trypsin n=2 Tax=Methylophaga TaxID=40222 RepID=UPI000C91B8C0|nr:MULTISPECIES: trypsin [unclassified Methylophaga]MAK67803.1 trypsin [Methylophaga sp.]MAY18484.1 trypsin [Methylophaga sp.]MBN45887.1 trypsin [Methylophaga sp.]HCD04981.1 trypsin [Methylophaga sp.]|tara:strand:+ start:16401 stop:17348 length:948 start_codon:yes stop_codon:yes gene_type:complete